MGSGFRASSKQTGSSSILLYALVLYRLVACKSILAVTTAYYVNPSCTGEPEYVINGVANAVNVMYPLDLCYYNPGTYGSSGGGVLALSSKAVQINSSLVLYNSYSDMNCANVVHSSSEDITGTCTESSIPGRYFEVGVFDVPQNVFVGIIGFEAAYFVSNSTDLCYPEILSAGIQPGIPVDAYTPSYIAGCATDPTNTYSGLYNDGVVLRFDSLNCTGPSETIPQDQCLEFSPSRSLYIGDFLDVNDITSLPSASPITVEPTSSPMTIEPTSSPVTIEPTASPTKVSPTNSSTSSPSSSSITGGADGLSSDVIALIAGVTSVAFLVLLAWFIVFFRRRQGVEQSLEGSSKDLSLGWNNANVKHQSETTVKGLLNPSNKPLPLTSHKARTVQNRKEVELKSQPLIASDVQAPVLLYDCFLTHNWSKDELGRDNHATVSRVNDALKQKGLKTWFDNDRMKGFILDQMTQGIDCSHVVVAFVTQTYINKVASGNHKDNCKREFTYAANQKSNTFIGVAMEPSTLDASAWRGPVGAVLGGKLYEANFAFDISVERNKFEEQVQNLYEQIVSLKEGAMLAASR